MITCFGEHGNQLHKKYLQGEKMTKNDKNVTRAYLEKLKQENEQLKKDNQILGNELTYFKEQCADLEDKVRDLKKQYDDFYEKDYVKRIDECNQLFGELQDIKSMSMFEFASKYCKDEQLEADGKAFSEALLGG